MKHPFQLVVSNSKGTLLFCAAKNTLQIFDLQNGHLIGSWVDSVDHKTVMEQQHQKKINALKLHQQDLAEISHEKPANGRKKIPKIPVPGSGAPQIYNYIRCLILSNSEKFLVITTDSDKAAIIFKLDYSNKLNILDCATIRHLFPKRPCSILTTPNDDFLILGDKFGDVYKLKIPENFTDYNPINNSYTLLLGHVSMLTDLLLWNQSVISADRDEHIRFSNFNNPFIIENFLFGHTQFISSLNIPKFNNNLLISAGGDQQIFFWNLSQTHQNHPILKFDIKPFIYPYLNKNHSIPKRFLKTKEFSISQIKTVSLTSNDNSILNLMIVLIEQTNVLLILKYNELDFANNKIKIDLFQLIQSQNTFINLSIINNINNNKIISSISNVNNDNTNDNVKLVEIYNFNQSSSQFELLTNADNIQITSQISNNNICNINSKKDLVPLFTINQLRKRSEH
ncbi:Trm82p [Ascoidea rubescens DSM 1968]|uniref:Guanine-N(7)--methyltransferase subunit TRM82 n=1 Tax=Ascoidea rubescens DSM 1968 TaxID=1344418 RepID=A0A1D2VAM2_9ASCO|nr:guanine-N(7)--methyltransferase subunit TRM82 [Ascoidea rubescens DSM 1968]ODV58605.1 guanine-N(7)--methyltransferase subunit TRM82 [Ascoidea rubescens DSM 1968]